MSLDIRTFGGMKAPPNKDITRRNISLVMLEPLYNNLLDKTSGVTGIAGNDLSCVSFQGSYVRLCHFKPWTRGPYSNITGLILQVFPKNRSVCGVLPCLKFI
jgi:hypothetical protein